MAFSLHPDYSYDPSARMAPILQELDNSELDALAQHLLHILHTPFGGKGAVESRPNISVQQLHSDRETTHARFWDLGGWRASPWPSNRDTEALPLKRLYEEPVRNLGSLGEEAKKRKAEELEALFGRVV